MGQVHPLPKAPAADEMPLPVPACEADVRSIDSTSCALCGEKLSARALRYHMVSPQSCEDRLTVCHVCRKAALGEGYRPAG
jgi:predicted RNA-binding Zn-ribbon protein involved in translation (DUF1610 family)